MATKEIISTDKAPAALGTYSQAVKVGQTVYISMQVPLHPQSMDLVGDVFSAQCERVFDNLRAVAEAAGGSLQDIVKLTVFLTDLANFPTVNDVMARSISEPYPARAVVCVSSLPKDARFAAEAIMEIAQ